MSLKWAILGSGSKANAYLFEHEGGAVAVDNGFPLKDFKKRAVQAGLDAAKVNTVLLTHTHGDHIRGLEGLLASTGALLVHRRELKIEAVFRKLKHVPAMVVDAHTSYEAAGVAFYPFDLSHDAPHATSYHFKIAGTRFTLITDTGRTDATMLKLAARSDVLFLEANYCPHLLEHGPYPALLRERVAGDRGHLSNHQAAAFLNQLADLGEGPSQVYLVHLSENNNTPERVAEVLRSECRWKGALRVCRRNELVVGT